jgi:hypothetical protein
MMKTDQRRYGVIEVRRLSGNCFHLTIDGVMWSEVEWSAFARQQPRDFAKPLTGLIAAGTMFCGSDGGQS